MLKLLFCIWVLYIIGAFCQFEWQPKDAFDEVRKKYDKVNRDNCEVQNLYDLFLPDDAVSHLPDLKDININPIFPIGLISCTSEMWLSACFFYSYILQARFIRPAINDTYDPGMMYYFLSTVADVSSNPHINASNLFRSELILLPSYRGFFNNKTMPRFAPRTFRADDFNLIPSTWREYRR
ncbi:Fras1 related extracellular matrix protein [Nesidiocoris tenuis]|uniref:Fras1 related extracellular matrix protein n=1 Tax=Nesidiocoris tenuis TaxID=355587 RepID=A0ABN7AJD5_9HEMI|nr:Fras1 related extracellular matrix protein [Nesidiocoris tenuis]